MLVNERERTAYNTDYDYVAGSRDRYARYDYDTRYEDERNRTSPSYRDSLMSNLERPASHSRLERIDDARYGFYMSNRIASGENNYDLFLDAKQKKEEETQKPTSGKKLAFLITYLAIALVAIIAVTLSVIGIGKQETAVQNTPVIENVSANAEVGKTEDSVENVTLETQEQTVLGGENYIMLKSGEIVEIEIPERAQVTQEEEKGFDKFCSWLNGVFGG